MHAQSTSSQIHVLKRRVEFSTFNSSSVSSVRGSNRSRTRLVFFLGSTVSTGSGSSESCSRSCCENEIGVVSIRAVKDDALENGGGIFSMIW